MDEVANRGNDVVTRFENTAEELGTFLEKLEESGADSLFGGIKDFVEVIDQLPGGTAEDAGSIVDAVEASFDRLHVAGVPDSSAPANDQTY